MTNGRRLSARALLLLGAAVTPIAPVQARGSEPQDQAGQTTGAGPGAPQTQQSASPAPSTEAGEPTPADGLQDVVVTGTTSRNRPLITSSADITFATREAIDRKAPRSTADLLELVPGIFVEGTAGELSNNYSVRGLQGGGQRFIQLEEDGLPIIYQGGGADFFFTQDLSIDRLEAVKGGSSGVLTVNGAGATINFISRRNNFNRPEAIARFTAYNYGLRRGDAYISAPIIKDKLAFSIGGFFQSNPGVRRNPFSYDGYRLKGSIEYRFDSGGYVRLTGRIGDLKAAYYAGQPYSFNNGRPGSLPGLDNQVDNIGGTAFSRIAVPVSTFVEADGFRDFNYSEGVRVKTQQLRIDIEKPLTDSIEVFARARYLGLKTDFNGLFPGSGTGNAGLTSAVAYLTPGDGSPINGLLTRGAAVFPTATRFGIRNLRTNVVLGSNQVAALNALNGNGFLQQTTLNHDFQSGFDFGSNFGARWEYQGRGFKNSLTVGVLYNNVGRYQNQSATSAVVNDVKNNSDIYDVVALDANNNVIGTLTDNGQISYGNWGAGIRRRTDSSVSVYANDEFQIGDLRIDGGIRWENDDARFLDGTTPTAAQAANPANRLIATAFDANGNPTEFQQLVQPGVANAAVVPTVGSTFGGSFNDIRRTQDRIAWTVGVNYLIRPNLSVYARYADGFQTNNTDPITGIELYEGGVRYEYRRLLSASVTVFQTNFRNQFYNFIDPTNPTIQTAFQADLSTFGVEVDALIRPLRWWSVDFFGVFQDPSLNNLRLNGQRQQGFDGNRPERTPATLFTVTSTFQLPRRLGEFYGRYKYIGKIFADSGNGVALPAYGVTSFGVSLNVTERLQASFNVDNVFDELGLTEGNPRQGQVQNATSGFFYARGIVGPTFGGSLTMRF